MKSTICIVEDREACEPCLRLLLLSLRLHCPETPVNLFYSAGNAAFLEWVRQHPQVRVHTSGLPTGHGWNIKPDAMMYLLRAGFDEVVWIDSDVIVTRNIGPTFSRLSPSTFVATEHPLGKERDDTNGRRASLWHLPVGRVLPAALNSGVLRVTDQHQHLLERWRELLASQTYRESQTKPWGARPIHMLSDQDVLTALLTSREFSDIPLEVLRRGKHIIQFDGVWGYTLAERIRNLLGDGPTFIHSCAGKPWSERWASVPTLREYVKMAYLDLSPYTFSAIRFRNQLGLPHAWMEPHFRLTRFLRRIGSRHAALTGLPMAVLADCARALRYVRELASPNGYVKATSTDPAA
jgi:hypothetical protein